MPRTRQFNDTLLADVHFWNHNGQRVLIYSMIDEATRFHVAEVVEDQTAYSLYQAIMRAWVKWAGPPRFLIVDPHRSQVAAHFVEKLAFQGTSVLAGAAEASWTSSVRTLPSLRTPPRRTRKATAPSRTESAYSRAC